MVEGMAISAEQFNISQRFEVRVDAVIIHVIALELDIHPATALAGIANDIGALMFDLLPVRPIESFAVSVQELYLRFVDPPALSVLAYLPQLIHPPAASNRLRIDATVRRAGEWLVLANGIHAARRYCTLAPSAR
jgi:hypothetical protein